MRNFSEAMGAGASPQVAAPKEQAQSDTLTPRQSVDGTPATEAQQSQYNRFVMMGMGVLWGEQMMPQIVQMLKQAPSKVDAMAQVGSMLVARLYASANEQGQDIDSAVLLYGGIELMGQVGELASTVIGQVTEAELEDAIYLGADMLGDVLQQQGIANPEVMAADLQEIEAMLDQQQVSEVIDRVSKAKQMTIDAMMQTRSGEMQ